MKKTKKYLLLFAFVFLCILCACHSNRQNSTKKIKIGIAVYQEDDTFISYLLESLRQAAKQQEKEEKIKVTIHVFDGKDNQVTQNDGINRLIEQRCDVLCVNLVDRTAAAAVIDKAKNADIPIVFFNREPVQEDMELWDKLYYVGAAAEQSGTLQGEAVLALWKQNPQKLDKNADGKVQYLMLEGEHGHQDALLRTEYSIKSMTKGGLETDRLANDTANWQRSPATTKVSRWIDDFGDTIELVLSNNDDMALGAADAFIAKNMDLPIIVGVDGTEAGQNAVRDGILYATVYNDYIGQANAIFKLCYDLQVYGHPSEEVKLTQNHYIRTPYQLVTMENIETFGKKD